MICQCMIQAFMSGWANDSYGLSDVEVGRQYAEDLMKYDRRKREPFHHYDLRTFVGWCDKEIERLKAPQPGLTLDLREGKVGE